MFLFQDNLKVEPDAKYVQDTPETVFDGPVIDLEELSKGTNLDLNA